jgi:MFS family permease
LAALINYSATFAVSFLLSLYLQYIKGFTPETAGLILIAQPVMMAMFSPLAGILSDRIEPLIVASVGMGLTTVGLFMLIFVSNGASIGYIVTSLIILGLGFGFFSSPNTNAVMGSVDRKFYGVASGMLGTMRLTGQAFSLGISLLLFAIFIGRVQITPEYYPLFLKSMRVAFIIMAALCFLGIFASIARGKTRNTVIR